MMIIFAYLPYGLAEGISLSGKRQYPACHGHGSRVDNMSCHVSCFLLAETEVL